MFLYEYEVIDPFVKFTGGHWLAEINIWSITIRLLLAVILGGIIGIDRALKHQAAGFRTHITVCLGAAIAMLTNEFISRATGLADSGRIGAQVISGIGFLGAGTIMFTSRNQVKGLTTAAGLWACACLGLAIGSGFYTLSFISAIIIIIVLTVLPYIEEYLTNRARQFTLHIEFNSGENLKDFIHYIRDQSLKIISLENNPAYKDSGLSVYTVHVRILGKKRHHQNILDEIRELPYISYIEEIY